ncbi:MAG: hypothetical protein KBD78_11585 [Oligoflexales bacterium]|nr:hypothetical protein [Oligoflexales bacterium]
MTSRKTSQTVLVAVITLVFALFNAQLFAQKLEIGKVPAVVGLSGDEGGRVDGTAWSSSEIKSKVFVMFYVDPDVKDLNEHVGDALKAENFPEEKFQSIAMINMAATWLPNFAIASSLKSKQEKFPRTIYVKDTNKTMVKQWGFTDDEYNIALFDHNGKLIMRKDGKFSPEDTSKLISDIKAAIKNIDSNS